LLVEMIQNSFAKLYITAYRN